MEPASKFPQRPESLRSTDHFAQSSDSSEDAFHRNNSGQSAQQYAEGLLGNPTKVRGVLSELDNIKTLKVTPTSDPHETAINLEFNHPENVKAPNVVVPAPFGFTGVPQDSTIDHVDFNVKTDPSHPDQLQITDMHNFNTTAKVIGPWGNQRGTKNGHTEWMEISGNSLDVKSDLQDDPLHLGAENFDAGSPMAQALEQKHERAQVFQVISQFQERGISVDVHQINAKTKDISIDLKQSKFPVHQKLDGIGGSLGFETTNLYVKNGHLHTEISNDSGHRTAKFTKGDVEVGLKIPFGGEMKVSVSSVTEGKDVHGKPIAHVEFYNVPKGVNIPIR